MNITEQKRVGLDFLYSFYMSIQQLKQARAIYRNILYEIHYNMNGSKDIDLSTEVKPLKDAVLDEQNKVNLNNQVQTVRFHITTIYDTFRTLKSKLTLDKDKLEDIESSYNIISTKYIIPDKELGDFVVALDSVMFDSVISETLQNNADIISDIYSTTTQNGNTTS